MAIFFFFCFGLGMFGTILKDHLIKTLSFCSWGLPRLWPTFEQTYDNGGGLHQLSGLICAYHRSVPGSNPKHTIKPFYSQMQHYICNLYTEKDENKQKETGFGPDFSPLPSQCFKPCLKTGYFLLWMSEHMLEETCMLLAGLRVHEYW